jgi:hypothetical protein
VKADTANKQLGLATSIDFLKEKYSSILALNDQYLQIESTIARDIIAPATEESSATA